MNKIAVVAKDKEHFENWAKEYVYNKKQFHCVIPEDYNTIRGIVFCNIISLSTCSGIFYHDLMQRVVTK